MTNPTTQFWNRLEILRGIAKARYALQWRNDPEVELMQNLLLYEQCRWHMIVLDLHNDDAVQYFCKGDSLELIAAQRGVRPQQIRLMIRRSIRRYLELQEAESENSA